MSDTDPNRSPMPDAAPGDPTTPPSAPPPGDAEAGAFDAPAGSAAGDVGPDPTAPGATDIPVEPPPPIEFTPEQIDALVAERDQFRDAYQRSAADFDNFRKQSQKRIADEVARAQGSFVERLLPVLDAIEAAQAHGSTDVDAVSEALFGFLGREGLERVRPAGEVFDPNVADAVMHEAGDDDGGEPMVTEVLRTGYLWNGRVIRPAMVKVAG